MAYAIDTDRLDHKWGVDGRKLRTRLNRASYGERMAIGEMTMAFYRRLDDGETGDVIETITALFQPQAPEGQPPAHSRLSPALLLGDDAAEQTAAAYQAAVGGTLAVMTKAPPRPGTGTETDPGGADDGPQTETQPAGPPEGPETPAAPPPGPEAIAPEMALDTAPTLSPDSSAPETGVTGNEAAPVTAPGDAAAALLAGLVPDAGAPEVETGTALLASASGDAEIATQAELSARAGSDVETATPHRECGHNRWYRRRRYPLGTCFTFGRNRRRRYPLGSCFTFGRNRRRRYPLGTCFTFERNRRRRYPLGTCNTFGRNLRRRH